MFTWPTELNLSFSFRKKACWTIFCCMEKILCLHTCKLIFLSIKKKLEEYTYFTNLHCYKTIILFISAFIFYDDDFTSNVPCLQAKNDDVIIQSCNIRCITRVWWVAYRWINQVISKNFTTWNHTWHATLTFFLMNWVILYNIYYL